MQVVSSVPLPSIFTKMGNSQWASCSKNGDLILRLSTGTLAEMPHEMACISANGAMLGYFDLHRTRGFEKAAIQDAALDSAGRIVLLVRNLTDVHVTRTDEQGRPRGVSFGIDRTLWVLTVDDNGKILSKFSFDSRVVMGLHFALFKSGNVLVTGTVQEGHSFRKSGPNKNGLQRQWQTRLDGTILVSFDHLCRNA